MLDQVCLVPSNSSILMQEALKQLLSPVDLYKYLKCSFDMWLYRQSNPAAAAADVAAQGAVSWDTLTDSMNGTDWQNAFGNSDTGAAALLTLIGGKLGGLWGGLASSGTAYTFATELLWDDPIKAGQSMLILDQSGNDFGQYVDDTLQFLAGQTGGDMADQVFRDALNTFTARYANINAGWPGPDATDANTAGLQITGLSLPASVLQGLQPDGTIQIPLASASDEFDAQLLAVQSIVNSASTDAAALDTSLLAQIPSSVLDSLTSIPNVVFAALDSSAWSSMLAGSTAAAQTKANAMTPLKEAQSIVSVLGQVVGLADKKAGQAVTVIGTAALNIANSIVNFSSTTSALVSKLGDIGTALGSAALTGNIIGAALSVVGLFLSGPDPTMLMLQSIQKAVTQLSQQVQQVASQMNERFDNVDRELQKTFTAVVDGFNNVFALLQGQQIQLNLIQDSLVGLANQLTRLSLELQSFLQSMENNDLTTVKNLVLNWRDTHVNPADVLAFEGDEPSFTQAENVFFTWATNTAVTEPQISAPGPVDPASLAGQLTQPVAANINVISSALSAAGLPSFGTAGQPLPNMNAWALGANYYAQLEWEWLSQYADQISGDRLNAVAAVGANLLAALTEIAALRPTANGPVEAPVFSGVAGAYARAVGNLLDGLRGDTIAFVENTFKVQLNFPSGWATDVDLFGASDQGLSIPPNVFTSWYPSIPVQLSGPSDQPNTITDTSVILGILQLIPQVVQSYIYLDSDKSSTGPSGLTLNAVCSWTDTHIQPGTVNRERMSLTTGHYQGTIQARWDNAAVAQWIYVNPAQCVIDFSGPDGWRPPGKVYDQDVETYYAELWNGSMTNATDGGPDPGFPAVAANLGSVVASRLSAAQTEVCNLLQQQIQSGDMLPLGQAVTGWKLLLDNLVQLALPNQVTGKDTLTALLRGSDAVFGADGIAAVLAARAGNPQLGVNVFDQISAVATARVSAAYQVILSSLQKLEAQGEWDFPRNVYGATLRVEAIAALRGLTGFAVRPERSQAYSAPNPGLWYSISDKGSGLSLSYDPSGGDSNGTALSSLSASGGDEQLWRFQAQPDGSYAVLNKASGRCLDVSGASVAQGAPLDLWDYSNGANQHWYLVYDLPGAVQFVAAHSGLVVQAGSNTAEQTSWSGLDSQRMQLTAAA